MHDILSYLAATYDPVAIIVYGSFADGTSNLFSDFDALLITEADERLHDDSFIDCTQLDVFIHPLSDFEPGYDPAEYVQVCGGQILLDHDGIAASLLKNVERYLDGRAGKTPEELRLDVDWCEKMLRRAERDDAEGAYRRHWLLVDSLEIYTELRAWRYLGPKKTLRMLETKDKEAFALYEAALLSNDLSSLSAWVAHIRECYEKSVRKAKKQKKRQNT